MKTLIILGHGGKDVGSPGIDGISEKDRLRILRDVIKDTTNSFDYKDAKNVTGNWAISKNMLAKYNQTLSIHFNSNDTMHGKKAGTGTEVLYKYAKNKKKAQELSKIISKTLGLPDRGAKYRENLYMLNIGCDMMLEVCFNNNINDIHKYNNNTQNVAKNIVSFLGGAIKKEEVKYMNCKMCEEVNFTKQLNDWSKEDIDYAMKLGIFNGNSASDLGLNRGLEKTLVWIVRSHRILEDKIEEVEKKLNE